MNADTCGTKRTRLVRDGDSPTRQIEDEDRSLDDGPGGRRCKLKKFVSDSRNCADSNPGIGYECLNSSNGEQVARRKTGGVAIAT